MMPMSGHPIIEMTDILFHYGPRKILENFNLSVDHGKTLCLVGSSGSGKTTTLRLMNGLLKPNSGEIRIKGEPFDFKKEEKIRRSMGYSIQGSGLFPHLNLYDNLSIIAKKEKWSRKAIDERIEELCQLMSLPKSWSFLQKKPRQISGGQQQRVGIARALFMSPQIMLMDEPFAGLDPITRSELQNEFLSLQSKLDITIVLVTHDLPEAFRMADEIVLLHHGKIEQKGKPNKFLLDPASKFVENFVQSHSPGSLLKEVYLYSVVNSDLYCARKLEDRVEICHLETGNRQRFATRADAMMFLKHAKQSCFYWVDSQGKFLSTECFDGSQTKDFILCTDNILNGMKAVLSMNGNPIPVLSENGLFIGVFSQEALNAL